MGFDGFPEEAFDFFAELREHNDRAWFAENRWRYDEVVLPSLRALIDDLNPELWPMPVYRLYRNVRFSADKTPYKVSTGASGSSFGGALHYVHVDASGFMVASGMHIFSNDQLRRYHAAVAAEDSGEELRVILNALIRRGLWDGGVERLSTAPKGYDRDHPRVHLMRLRGITMAHRWHREHAWLRTRRVPSMVNDTVLVDAAPLNRWLEEFVGPPDF